MAAEWQGKSRGTVLGYKIFVFFMKNFGLGAAYFILYFVATYFCFFARDSSKAIYYYFKERLQYSKEKSLWSIFKSYYVFGQTIIDKVAISSGLRDKFTYEFDGIKLLKSAFKIILIRLPGFHGCQLLVIVVGDHFKVNLNLFRRFISGNSLNERSILFKENNTGITL